MSNIEKLTNLTMKLQSHLDFIDKKFKEVKQSELKGDFYTEVKPFADEVKGINDEWKIEADIWVKTTRPKHIHLKQIESTHEQIEMLSVQAFFPETSLTRFINYLQSVRYILKVIIDQINKQ